MRTVPRLGVILCLVGSSALGCAGGQPFYQADGMLMTARSTAPEMAQPTPSTTNGENANGKQDKPPKSLFDWSIGPKTEPEESEAEEEDVIVTDRPDFTEASSTVGRNRIQLEGGYTYFRSNDRDSRSQAHSFPETLLRFGLFADWLEGRVAWNYGHESNRASGVRSTFAGGDDLYLGVKLYLTEQKSYLPESAINLQMTVPTGCSEFTANTVLPGFNYLFGWDINEFLAAGGSFAMNRARDDLAHSYLETAGSFTINYTLTKKLGAYTESFALFPSGSIDPAIGPEYYFDGGFTYKVTNNFQLDIRAGVGLNDHADDFFAGAGFAVRY
jgi:hypothetical protein